MANADHWTTAPPTEPGWYWFDYGAGPIMVELTHRRVVVHYPSGSRTALSAVPSSALWAGPLTPPVNRIVRGGAPV